MNCSTATANPNSPFLVISGSNNSPQTRIPESVSFASQVSKSRISIKSPPGPRTRPATRIQAFYTPAGTVESPYQVLGIEESGSTRSDIKKAYKQMARKYHPDVSPPDRVDEYTRRFILVKEAYDTLSNPETRDSYDTRNHQETEEKGEWRMRWQSQLDELKRRSKSSSRTGRMSWGARMRTGTEV